MNARTPRDLHSDLGPSSKDWLPDSERSPDDAKAPFRPEPEASAGDEDDARMGPRNKKSAGRGRRERLDSGGPRRPPEAGFASAP